MRFMVTGGRDFNDWALVRHALQFLPADAVLVHGACSGADAMCAELWGDIRKRKCEEHPANWAVCEGPNCTPEHRRSNKWGKEYCPTAGHWRNQKMVDSGVELCIAFPGNTGTADAVQRAKKADVPILDLRDSSHTTTPAQMLYPGFAT